MLRTIGVALAQMDVDPAPTATRLDRADRLVVQAARAGARLVVLPELFNTGYAYADANFRLAEPLDGPTAGWMKQSAERLGIHLAGSLMLLEDGEIYNALLLFSPSGQMWRYDKNYPWAWERGYYRGRRGMTVAHTELGDLGMMICWDVGHRRLWKGYAGRVDLMIIASCPPDGTSPVFRFPDGDDLTLDDLPFMASVKGSGKQVFGEMVDQQAAWLGVPAVNTGGSGQVQTRVPRGSAFLGGLAFLAPRLLKRWRQADRMEMTCEMIPSCKAVDASGRRLCARSPAEGEGFTLTEVTLPDRKPSPRGPQPKSPLSRQAYLTADVLIPFLMRPVYRRGLKSRTR